MGSSVATNVSALVAHRNLTWSSDTMERALERLSSGHRINRAADDAAGLAIAQNLCVQAFSRSQIPSQAGTAMLAQAAKGPQYVLALLS